MIALPPTMSRQNDWDSFLTGASLYSLPCCMHTYTFPQRTQSLQSHAMYTMQREDICFYPCTPAAVPASSVAHFLAFIAFIACLLFLESSASLATMKYAIGCSSSALHWTKTKMSDAPHNYMRKPASIFLTSQS